VTTPVPAVERAVAILTLMAQQPETRYRSSELARELKISKATCFSILVVLQEAGLLERYEDKTYALGPLLAAIGAAAQRRHPGLLYASAEVQQLSRKLQVQCYVAVRTAEEIIVVERTVPLGHISAQSSFNGPRTRFAPPAGLVYMSWEEPKAFDEWLEAHGVVEKGKQDRYRDAARIVRERGYAGGLESQQAQLLILLSQMSSSRGSKSKELVASELSNVLRHGVNFLSAPVFSADGSVTLALTIIDPPEAVAGSQFDTMVAELKAAAGRVTSSVGGTAPRRKASR
jgi:DNA-binding IclR family transcriptional regulator